MVDPLSCKVSSQVDTATQSPEHAPVQQDGGELSVTIPVLLELTEPTAPAPVCVRTREESAL